LIKATLSKPILLSFCFTLLLIPLLAKAQKTCSYNSYQWDTKTGKAVNFHRVSKPYSHITPIEKAEEAPCSVCEEDQVSFTLTNSLGKDIELTLCKYIAGKVEATLKKLIAQGEPIYSLQGYRPGMTAGKADANGLRTRFSRHSFGIAVDINREQNGLYKNCDTPGRINPQCKLSHGGPWNPKTPGSLTADSLTVLSFKEIGLKWGGEIAGAQKDFMHFSPTGY